MYVSPLAIIVVNSVVPTDKRTLGDELGIDETTKGGSDSTTVGIRLDSDIITVGKRLDSNVTNVGTTLNSDISPVGTPLGSNFTVGLFVVGVPVGSTVTVWVGDNEDNDGTSVGD
jgi:hypothetical protein